MESIKKLRKICQVPMAEKPILLQIVEFFSIYLTWVFLHFKKITANQITVGSTVLFILASFCYIKGEYRLNLIGLFFLWLAIILDFVDGEVARYKGEASNIGGNFIEPFTHDVKYALLFIPLTLGEYSSFSYPTLLIFLGFAASLFKVLFRLAKLRYLHVIHPLPLKSSEPEVGARAFYSNKRLRKILKYFGGTTAILFYLLPATIFDKVYLIVIFYGILFPIIYLVLLIKQYRGIKNLKI